MLGLQARGKKEGVDFAKGQLDASKQAERMRERVEVVGGGVGAGVNGVTGVLGGGL
jgi:hypothetical protein